jgi:hypothetical protein
MSHIRLSDYIFRHIIIFPAYRTIGLSNTEIAKSRNDRTTGYWNMASI